MKVIAWIFTLLILISVLIGIVIFWPVFKVEIKYRFDQTSHVSYVIGTEQLSTLQKPIAPPNTDYSIVITKIAASAKITDNVDIKSPFYTMNALKQGIAQAGGTKEPGELGNVFLFAQSGKFPWEVTGQNTIFYLANKLKAGDEIDIYYQGNQIKYSVYDTKITGPDDSQYMGTLIPEEKTLTLETYYPEGTPFKRLLIFAKQNE